MKYDFSDKAQRSRFVARANSLLRKRRTCVSLLDESNRTVNQNSYIHVLCRIMAEGTGTTERYAKQVYFKELANPDLFVRVTKDPLTNQMIKTIRSTCDLTIPEMSKAINNFIIWAGEQGYSMPEASLKEDGSVTFSSTEDEEAFKQADIETSKVEEFL